MAYITDRSTAPLVNTTGPAAAFTPSTAAHAKLARLTTGLFRSISDEEIPPSRAESTLTVPYSTRPSPAFSPEIARALSTTDAAAGCGAKISSLPDLAPLSSFAAALKKFYKGPLTPKDLEQEIEVIFARAAAQGSLEAYETVLHRAEESRQPRSFILSQEKGIPCATILFNRLKKGDQLALPKGLGAYKTFKWGIHICLNNPSSLTHVLVASQKCLSTTSSESRALHALSDEDNIVHLFASHVKESKKTKIGKKELQVFEYCAKGDLYDFVVSEPSFPFIIKALFDTSKALLAMHARGLAHRDLKLENVFLTEEIVAKVGDLGTAIDVSKKGSTNYLSYEQMTPLFIAPECAKRVCHLADDGTRDHLAADIWSFGMMMLMALARLKYIPSWHRATSRATVVCLGAITQETLDAEITPLLNHIAPELKKMITDTLRINPLERLPLGVISEVLKKFIH